MLPRKHAMAMATRDLASRFPNTGRVLANPQALRFFLAA
jgi:hypothetical protein